MFTRISFVVIALMFVSRSSACAEDSRELARQCVKAINAITSYDVKMKITNIAYPAAYDTVKPNEPLETMTLMHRDVLAWGYGRRAERNLNDLEEHVAVKAWDDAMKGRKGLAIEISYTDGQDYFTYFNQNCFGLLLSQLLEDTRTSVDEIKPDDNQLRGFELVHPNLQAPVRVWVDPVYGYLPATIEKDAISDGKAVLHTRSHVDEFVQVADTVWVPLRGSYTQFSRAGPSTGRAVNAYSMSVLREESSWNAISSGELFATANMPEVNHELLGWKEHLPPAALLAMGFRDRLVITDGKSGTLLIVVNVLIVIGLIAFILVKKQRRRLKNLPRI